MESVFKTDFKADIFLPGMFLQSNDSEFSKTTGKLYCIQALSSMFNNVSLLPWLTKLCAQIFTTEEAVVKD